MPKHPLVSIIIPTYNRTHLIGETLNSVLAQTYTNWECLVIDDGSTDNTEDVLKTYINKDLRIQYHKRPETHLSGGNGARNYGFKLSKGDYIQWFDSDDVMYPNYLERQLKHIQTHQANFSLCLYDLQNEITSTIKTGEPQVLRHGFYYDYITRILAANLPTLLFKKSCLLGISLNEKLLKSQEYEFLQRFFRAYEKTGVLLNMSLLKVVRHQNSITEKHTSKKIASALEALLITYSELPKDSPEYVRKKLTILYLKTLYMAFTNRMTETFYKYLFKLLKFHVFKGLLLCAYLGVLYGFVQVFPIGNWHYKACYKLYR
ncbi:glycosyltransferase family 2 protein [Mangrovimonas spongiae]|uniref:Glycosyltransferase family 2 protein n=1 Tax=Mangrovimonas spongiae TaxID=2494697 RepID=A0A3R9UUM3_9FLAO|nr:glycosyltransferase family 2 protein [Mangrovimonas spongiae]RSK40507.1 glycosyltransferase family 2 protein [Mangrovimonas spongiae]